MPKRKLTAAAIERIKPPQSGQIDHFDAGYPGLALRVSYGGRRSWIFFYRLHGKQRRLTLGTFPALELADAREAWRAAREAVEKGTDPAEAKRSAKQAAADNTFAAVAAQWLKRDQAGNRSAPEVARILERDVTPKWATRHIKTIKRRDVLDLIDGIADRGAPTLARRIHAHLHRLFRWSVGRGIVEASPMADLPKPSKEVRRDRVLSDAELATVWKAADEIGWPFGPALRLLILTGARREEIGALRWAEIEGDEIHLAGERTKNGEPHNIPLVPEARTIIDGLPRVMHEGKPSPFVFTTTGKTPVSGWSKAKRLLDEATAKKNEGSPLPGWRIHDLRRTVATGMQRLGIGLQVVEAVLGHISGSRAGIVGVYQRHDYADEKARALAAWARHVASLVEKKPANVVPIRGAEK